MIKKMILKSGEITCAGLVFSSNPVSLNPDFPTSQVNIHHLLTHIHYLHFTFSYCKSSQLTLFASGGGAYMINASTSTPATYLHNYVSALKKLDFSQVWKREVCFYPVKWFRFAEKKCLPEIPEFHLGRPIQTGSKASPTYERSKSS